MRVLSIDPGYGRTGIAVLEKKPGKAEVLLYSGCFETSSDEPFSVRLVSLGHEIERIIHEHRPGTLAIEELFFNSNQKTAFRVSEARGVVLYVAASSGLVVYEYTPLQVKIAITGYGRGTKQQVIAMTKRLVPIGKPIKYDDEYDAIAVGLTCLASIHRKESVSE